VNRERFATVYDAFSAGNFCILLNLIVFQSFGFIQLPWYGILFPIFIQTGFTLTVFMLTFSIVFTNKILAKSKRN
jgi:hypothetical protein